MSGGAPDHQGPGEHSGAHRGAGAHSGAHYIYGRNAVREALRGHRRVTRIFLVVGPVGDDLEASVPDWVAAGANRSAERAAHATPLGGTGWVDPPMRRMTPHELAALATTGDHQGIVAEVEPYPYVDPTHVLSNHTLLVALDEVQDPHNLGAVIRTAAAAGAGVVIPRHRAAEITGAVVKASAGVTERAHVAQVRNLTDFLAEAKGAGFWIYGASGGAVNDYTAQDYSYSTCFVVGSEGGGLGRRVESMCDVMVRIPLAGGVESLNVSVSAGILLYEAVRQRRVCSEAGAL
ncbi:MAG: 23S rRNA (guanosine(2251)-2'-O)-methyltransferase RlmB [Actinobacteria bacterium]|nr:23S rRNA (guanosine(2251)-2'-O)-methyltransferase RlmB [Actinomycetota bacterium]